MLQNADRIRCCKYITPASLVAGNPRLNLAFTANLFNTWPGLARALDEADERRRSAAAAAAMRDEETLEGLDEEELDGFILSEEEVRVKERVWVELNREYLEGIAGTRFGFFMHV